MLRLALSLSLAACCTATSASTLSLAVVGPGGSATSPTRGTTVQLQLQCLGGTSPGPCPPWVRVDRTDGVSDTTPFVRPVDEGYTFTWAPTFPYYFKPEWSTNHSFSFGGSATGEPVGIVASGWTDRYNGTQLTANTSALLIHYSTSFEDSNSTLLVENAGPGSARLTLRNNADVEAFDTVRFDRYFSNLTSTESPPEFIVDFFFNQHSGTGSLLLTFQEPGVYYYGVTPTYKGRAGGASAGGVFGSCTPVKNAAPVAGSACQPTTHPTALVVKGPDGETGNQTVVPGFAGVVHHMEPLRTRHQFCIFETNLTVFNGAQLRLPLCRPGKAEQPPQPGFISIIAPSWMTVRPQTNETCARCRNIARTGVALNSSKALHGGMTRYTFAALGNAQRPEDPEKANSDRYVDGYMTAHWSTYNNYAPFYISWGPDQASNDEQRGKMGELKVLIHYTPSEGATVAEEKWQQLTVRCVETPALKHLPKRLVTSVTWASIGAENVF
eukprot:COSAG06_NODE_285_length_18323_cov_93.673672_19_plen_498_part_00